MTSRDFTRWNRTGLSRFDYIGGNGPTFLEDIRKHHAKTFSDWANQLNDGINLHETESEKLERLAEQYLGERRDWGWEISRSFARAMQVLTGHIDAFANEGFIGTATQWDNLRRLVSMIDYRPRPAASAQTHLIIEASGTGLLDSGYQVKHEPVDGGSPVVFETLEDVELDPALNTIRLHGWSTNRSSFDPFATGIWPLPEGSTPSAGQYAVLEDHNKNIARAVSVESIDKKTLAIRLEQSPDETDPERNNKKVWRKGNTTLHLTPSRVIRAHLKGENVAVFEEPHGLSKGAVVAWNKSESEEKDQYVFARVLEADTYGLKLDQIAPRKKKLFAALEVNRDQYSNNEKQWRFPLEGALRVVFVKNDASFSKTFKDGSGAFEMDPDGYRVFKAPGSDSAPAVYFFDPTTPEPLGTVKIQSGPQDYLIEGGPGDLESGMWLVGESTLGDSKAVLIESIETRENDFTIRIRWPLPTLAFARFHGPFTQKVNCPDYDRCHAPVNELKVRIDLEKGEPWPPLLSAGRTVMVEREGSESIAHAFVTRIVEVDRQSGKITLDTELSERSGFTIGNLIIRGNVAKSGHGEIKPQKVLGSGNATIPGQYFILEAENVSFTPDASMTLGVAAALDIIVEGRRWQQSESLRTSGAADAHYTVRLTEAGHLSIAFGDGINGRRLPTGTNNVVAQYRVGAGLQGNVKSGGLEKPIAEHPFVKAIRQPIDATGGDNADGDDVLRENAASNILALGRAVSLEDFARLAKAQPGVLHAKAFHNPQGKGRRESVEVVVVPIGGGSLGDLESILLNIFTKNSLPGVSVTVSLYKPLEIEMSVRLTIDLAGYDRGVVYESVRGNLASLLALESREPGQPLYRSEIIQTIEQTPGVIASDVHLFPSLSDGQDVTERSDRRMRARMRKVVSKNTNWIIRPKKHQVLYLTSGSTVDISEWENAQ